MRRTLATTLFVILGVMGTASVALAAEAEKGSDVVGDNMHAGTFIVTIVIFVCLFLVLRKFAWKPILTGLKTREDAIRDAIESAKRAKEDAERTTKELEAKMAEVQRQAAAQLQQAKGDAIKIADAIRAQAEAESLAMKDRALREISAAKQQAVTEINDHAAELGTAVARKILQRNVTADDQQKLVEQSLSEMAKKN